MTLPFPKTSINGCPPLVRASITIPIHFYAGVSVPNVMRSRLSGLDLASTGIQKVNDFHVFVNAGIMIDLNDDVKLKPSLMLKSVSGAPYEADVNFNVWLKDMLGLGVSYRTGDAVIALVGLQNDHFKFGYSYDVTVSKLSGNTAGSHEISLQVRWGCKKPRPRYRLEVCPSF